MLRWFPILILLFAPFSGSTQNLTGIWKGYFTTGFGDGKQYYKYEVQIKVNATANNLSGISYSYLNADFYGKSQLEGYYDATNKKLDLKEAKLISFSNTNSSNVCLMHTRLSYLKTGNDEILEGTFASNNSVTGADCGQGYVHLERSTKSDFYIEPFLAKGKSKTTNKLKKKEPTQTIVKTKKSNSDKIAQKTKLPNTDVASISPKDIAAPSDVADTLPIISSSVEHNNSNVDIANPVIETFASIPEYFQKRKNKLVKTIITHTPEVDISFYDNGEIDDDSITVYHNLNPIVEHGRLSRQPINYGFDASDNNRLQSFIIVADNLGKIPPNSALMVVYTNRQRYEIFIESDLKNNGEVRIVYEPIKKNGK